MAPDTLSELVCSALTRANTSQHNAHSVARALVAADMDGLSSHGVSRLPAYADQAASGKVDGQATPVLESPAPAVVRVDACCGFAYPAIDAGMEATLASLRENGIAAMAVRNSHHFGVAGHHVERAADSGAVALAFGNSPAAIAPWGGSQPVFGTNPIAFATPRRDKPSLVVDLSLSKVARGKVMVARDRCESIPEGWALDREGRATTDPAAVLDGGTMLPLGDAKGAALALAVEILAAGLTGARFGFEASSFFSAQGEPPRVGQLFVLFDPQLFGGNEYPDRIQCLLEAIASQDNTRLPGERRLNNRRRHALQGIEIPDELFEEVRRRTGSTA